MIVHAKKIFAENFLLYFAPIAAILTIIIATAAHTNLFQMEYQIAQRGFSILEVIAAHANPENFARDYPGGARLTTAMSPTIWLYIFGHSQLGLNGLTILYGMIFFEICTLLGGAWLLWNTLFAGTEDDDTLRLAVRTGFIWAAVLLTMSAMQRANIVNFGFPYFHGQFYGFADGLRLAGVAMVLKQRWLFAALLFTACFVIHPIKAVMGMAFAGTLALFAWRAMLSWRFALAAVIVVIGCGFNYLQIAPSGQPVPLDDFVGYTRTLQVHWYPVDLGLFGARHFIGISPFSAVLLVTLVALAQPGWPKGLPLKLTAGLGMLLVISLVGVLVSMDPPSATLVRVSLARASTMISLLSPLLIMAGAVFSLRKSRWWMAAAFFAFCGAAIDPSTGVRQLAPAFAVAIAIGHLLTVGRADCLVIAGTILVTGVMAWVAATETGIVGVLSAAVPSLVLFVVFAAVGELFTLRTKGLLRARSLLALVTIAMLAAGTDFALTKITNEPKNGTFDADYFEAQLWARDNTESDALFMVDPCRWYGWRDFSERSSIGTVREWYMTAWIYTDRGDLLERGEEIANSLGFNMQPFRNAPGKITTLCRAARAAYYHPSMDGLKRLVSEENVDFFVFEKAFADNLLFEVEGELVFENAHIAVLPASELE